MDLLSDTNLNELEKIIASVCPMLKEKINQFKARPGKLQILPATTNVGMRPQKQTLETAGKQEERGKRDKKMMFISKSFLLKIINIKL